MRQDSDREISMQIEDIDPYAPHEGPRSPLKPKQMKLDIFTFDVSRDLLKRICHNLLQSASLEQMITNVNLLYSILKLQSKFSLKAQIPFSPEYARILLDCFTKLLKQTTAAKVAEQPAPNSIKMLVILLFKLNVILKDRDPPKSKEAGRKSSPDKRDAQPN